MSTVSSTERLVFDKAGNVRASYLRFRLDNNEDSDVWSDEDDLNEDDDSDELPVKESNPSIVDLSNQNLTAFSLSQLSNPTQLKYLYLRQNNLKQLPEDLFLCCPNLEWLDVRNNLLTCLPMFHSHQNIKTILAENNKIKFLPEDCTSARNLTSLQVDNINLLTSRVNEQESKKGSINDLGNSFDSGVELKEEDESTEYSESISKVHQEQSDADEIQEFLANKDLYSGKQLANSEKEFNFDDYEYCYKSFHSPLLDKQFAGLSLEQIKEASLRMEHKKEEQKKKREISEALQQLNTKRAMMTWRDKYRRQKQITAKKYRDEDLEAPEIDPPYDQDPDWTVNNCSFNDKVFHPAAGGKDVKFNDVVKAIEVLEDQIDDEVDKVVRSTSRPGTVQTGVRERRSAKIDRLNHKLSSARRKARAMSAHASVQ